MKRQYLLNFIIISAYYTNTECSLKVSFIQLIPEFYFEGLFIFIKDDYDAY
ncbi:MAG: hypothetical protein MJ252_02780 [archaeon]|nr:hypothetical protein [archaeon]